MAATETIENLQEVVGELLALDRENLRRRPEWGKFNFEDAEPNLERIFVVVAHLKTLPLRYLPEDIANTITQQVRNAVNSLNQLEAFDIEAGNPGAQRKTLADAVGPVADNLYKVVTPWIPFLAYQEGDVARNINELTNSVTNGRELVDKAKTAIESRNGEMEKIIEAAREASASAGAAVFTQNFNDECDERRKSAKTWLIATGVLAAVSTIVAVLAALPQVLPAPTTVYEAGPRFFLLALLLTATLWSGRLYKAFMHQAAVNRHRALALQTFQAFSKAASDEQTKNAVLLEATHSIFGPSATGFLDAKANPADSGTKVIEIMKAAGVGK